MSSRLLRSVGMAALVAATSAFVVPNVCAQADPQAHIAASEATLSNFLRDPNMGWLQQNFSRAKAVIITPVIVKAGFIFGIPDLPPGPHTLTVEVVAKDGGKLVLTRRFTVQ